MDNESSRKKAVSECPVCGSRRFTYLFAVATHRLVRCRECEFTLLNPQPSDDELREIYSADYFLGHADAAQQALFARLKTRTAESYLDQIRAYSGLSSGNFLEIGSGRGAMLVAAARRGFRVTGVEYSSHACAYARDALAAEGLSGELVCGEIDAVAHRGGEFDVCVMADLIEHVRDPRHFVRVLHKVLRPGGVIFIATPTLDSWSARLMSTRWMEFKPEHLSYFSRKSLEGLLFSEGFRTLATVPGVKVLSYDYIRAHFERFPIPVVTRAVKAVGAMLPNSVRSRERQLVASGMVLMGRRAEKPARPKLSIIIPAYNEAATFTQAFDRVLTQPLPGLDAEYIVVESNSTDGTRDLVRRYEGRPGVRILLEDRPRGKGHAVRTGLAAASGDFVAIHDADLEYDLEDYPELLDPLVHHREAFVLGARHGGRAWKMRQFTNQPVTSLFLNFGHWFFTTLLNIAFLVRLRDPFTMHKLFRRDCIHGLTFECDRFDFDWELVIKLIRRGYVPAEIPVNYRSRSFKEGKKVSVVRDPLTWLRAVLRFRFAPISRWAPPQPSVVQNATTASTESADRSAIAP